MEKFQNCAFMCARLIDECFNFPPLESLMGDEPKEARKVRRAHQTCREDGEATGTPAERRSGRRRGQYALFSK